MQLVRENKRLSLGNGGGVRKRINNPALILFGVRGSRGRFWQKFGILLLKSRIIKQKSCNPCNVCFLTWPTTKG